MPWGPLWFILSYLGRTVGYFLPLSLVWCLLVLWKLVLGEEAAKSDAAQVLWALCLKYDDFSSRDLTSLLGGHQGQQPQPVMF